MANKLHEKLEEHLKHYVIEDIKKVDKEIDGYMSFQKYINKGKFSSEPIRVFNSWSKAREEAGLQSYKTRKSIDEERLEALLKENKNLNELDEHFNCSKRTLSDKIKEMGYKSNRKVDIRQIGKNRKNNYIQVTIHENHLEKVLDSTDTGTPFFYEIEADKDNNEIKLVVKNNLWEKK